MAFQQARREHAKLRLALDGLAGSGKTYTALLVASILAELMRKQTGRRGRIAVIDTEHESASLYAMTDEQRDAYAQLSGDEAIAFLIREQAFDFDAMPLDNHSPRAYVDAINEAQSLGYDVCLVDSLSHAWAGKNGALEQKDKAAARGGNSWTAWRDITPMHNQLVDTMLATKMHLIATMRVKMEHIQTERDGKKVIEKVGLATIQREGMEYEFTIVGDMAGTTMTISKSRLAGVMAPGDVYERPGENFTRKVWSWLMSGTKPTERRAPAQQATAPVVMDETERRAADLFNRLELAASKKEIEAILPDLSKLATDVPRLKTEIRKRYDERKRWIEREDEKFAASMDPTSSASSSGEAPNQSHSANSSARSTEPSATSDEEREYIESLQPENLVNRDSAA